MKADWPGKLGLVVGAVVLTLGALEIGLRLSHGSIAAWPNFVLDSRKAQTTQNESRYVQDPILGYVPRPNYRATGVSFDADGFRGTPTRPDRDTILAVGDSFTSGEEVNDDQTWPALLQRLLDRPVLNGGVSGYGLDQIVLRAERIVRQKQPSMVVVSFIADDVLRTEMRRRWSAEKPYFDIENGTLVLRNVPIGSSDPRTGLSLLDRTLGHSFLLHFIMRRLDLWNDWHGDHVRVHPSGMGEKIACLLTRRLAELQRASGARILVVAQYDSYVWRSTSFAAEQRRLTDGVLGCSRQNGLEILDTFDALASHRGNGGGPGGLYREWHMNEAGNRLTAELIAAALGPPAH